MSDKQKLIFATGNAHKVLEVNEILRDTDYYAVPMSEYGVTEDIPETGQSMFENAWIKADYLKDKLSVDCFAEDSGLEIEALDMEPGIYTARYAGDHRSHIDNMDKVLDKLKYKESRKAQFRAVIALHINGEKKTFVGVVKGSIAKEKRGEGGFGYDPIFIPDGYDKTFAELPEEIKETISHRAQAVTKMCEYLRGVRISNIVSVEWLQKNIDDESLVVLDASMPSVSGKKSEFPNTIIPGSIFMNLKSDFIDKSSDLPNTVPDNSTFAQACSDLGITNQHKIVIYDNLGVYSSPRAWYLFKLFGHENVSVLNGGLPAWVNAGNVTVDSYSPAMIKSNYNPKLKIDWLTTKVDLLEIINSASCEILDARSKGRFHGTEPEPRKGLRGGHMPGSKSAPYSIFIENNKIKPESERREIFKDLVQTNKPIIFSCGSGITACINLLSVVDFAENNLSVFDGSWTEWALDEEMPVE